MKDTFAKIFELPDHQVLVVRGADQTTGHPFVMVTSHVDGVAVNDTRWFDEAKARQYWEEYDEAQAKAFVAIFATAG